jgi:hypothetical protein
MDSVEVGLRASIIVTKKSSAREGRPFPSSGLASVSATWWHRGFALSYLSTVFQRQSDLYFQSFEVYARHSMISFRGILMYGNLKRIQISSCPLRVQGRAVFSAFRRANSRGLGLRNYFARYSPLRNVATTIHALQDLESDTAANERRRQF